MVWVVVQVAGEVNIKTIFRREPQEATAVIIEAKKVLDSWHSTYLEVRDKIEQNLTDHRWEFDKKVRERGEGVGCGWRGGGGGVGGF